MPVVIASGTAQELNQLPPTYNIRRERRRRGAERRKEERSESEAERNEVDRRV